MNIRHCSSGHDEFETEFGADANRHDGVNLYCRECCRKKAQERRDDIKSAGIIYRRPKREACALDVNHNLTDAEKSERAISAERHKRRVEKEIELRLRDSGEVKEVSNKSTFMGLGYFMREPKPSGRSGGWFCPIGTISS